MFWPVINSSVVIIQVEWSIIINIWLEIQGQELRKVIYNPTSRIRSTFWRKL